MNKSVVKNEILKSLIEKSQIKSMVIKQNSRKLY